MASRDCSYFITLITLALVLMWWSLNLTAGDEVEEQFEDDADERLLRKMPSPLPTPSPSPITGPQLMRPLVGECYQFTGKDGNGDENRYEVCGYKSVRQTIVKNGHSYSTGYWAKWNTEEVDGKTLYSSHLYNDGESCGGNVRRETTVVFECDASLKAPKLLSATEPEMCSYELRMALPQWCEVEKAGLATKFVRKFKTPAAA